MKRWLIGSVTLGTLGALAAWLFIINSEAYAAAKQFLRESSEVKAKFGDVQDMSLRSFRMKNETARLRIAVDGTLGDGPITIQMKKEQNWEIKKISYD